MKNKTIKINNVEYMSYPEESSRYCDGCHFEYTDCKDVYSLAGGCENTGIIWKKVEGHPHAKLMMEYAQDCLVNQHAYEKWEFSHKGILPIKWMSLNDHPEWEPGCDYRRKLSVIMIDGSEVPKPASQPLTRDDEYWVAIPGHSEHLTWYGDRFDLAFLNAGLVHLSKEAAEKHIEVLYAYNKKCCNA